MPRRSQIPEIFRLPKALGFTSVMAIQDIKKDDGLLSNSGLLRKIDQLRELNINQYVALPQV
jgi:hypothetical protein